MIKLKETYTVLEHLNFSSCTRSQWAWAEDATTMFFQSTFWAT